MRMAWGNVWCGVIMKLRAGSYTPDRDLYVRSPLDDLHPEIVGPKADAVSHLLVVGEVLVGS